MRHVDVPVVATKDRRGAPNGRLLPLANVHESTGPFSLGRAVEQVYVTTIAPGTVKGPHLHLRRSGFFTPVAGDVTFVIRRAAGDYEVVRVTRDRPRTVYVPAGVPSAMANPGSDEALVVNVVDRAWRPDDRDDEPVEGWGFDFAEVLP